MMRKMVKLFLLLFLTVCNCLTAVGQQWDFISWTGIQAKGKLTKKLGLAIEQQLRLKENSTTVDKTFTELGLSYDLPKGFGITAEYRLSHEPQKEGEMRAASRYNFDLTYSKKFLKLRAKVRARFQHAPNATGSNERVAFNEDPLNLRLKISLSYNGIKRFTPGLAYEVFLLANNAARSGFNKFRYRAFINYKLNKRHGLGAFYMVQTVYSGAFPRFDSVLAVNYTYTWKRPKKRNKK